jgi:hypothetical protein
MATAWRCEMRCVGVLLSSCFAAIPLAGVILARSEPAKNAVNRCFQSGTKNQNHRWRNECGKTGLSAQRQRAPWRMGQTWRRIVRVYGRAMPPAAQRPRFPRENGQSPRHARCGQGSEQSGRSFRSIHGHGRCLRRSGRQRGDSQLASQGGHSDSKTGSGRQDRACCCAKIISQRP